jgi:HD superfamily phosphohydrolase
MTGNYIRVRDPIHGFIHLTKQELNLVESAPFRRLRNIRQLALTYLVYPGAMHTRFEHSLGVMELATRAFDARDVCDPEIPAGAGMT